MIDINSLKIGDSVNHIEHGLVTIVMLQAYKGYDFINKVKAAGGFATVSVQLA